MSDPQFFQTRMGQRYYEHTVPELAKQIRQLNENLKRLTEVLAESADREGREGSRD